MKWRHFPCYWPLVRGIHRSPVNSPHKGQWRGALMFHLICTWINGWVNNHEAGDLRCYRTHYNVTVMSTVCHESWGRRRWKGSDKVKGFVWYNTRVCLLSHHQGTIYHYTSKQNAIGLGTVCNRYIMTSVHRLYIYIYIYIYIYMYTLHWKYTVMKLFMLYIPFPQQTKYYRPGYSM